MVKFNTNIKHVIRDIPLFGSILIYIYRQYINPEIPFISSENYWIHRYAKGGSSGDGSCGQLAEYKARIINEFVRQNMIASVIELGCGDGSQLKLAEYPLYTGFDVSLKALSICEEVFLYDTTKYFKLMDSYNNETAELGLSLDVIFHLVEDSVFAEYMNMLFSVGMKYIIIYSSDSDENLKDQPTHVRHRNFTLWIEQKMPEWKLIKYIANQFPFNGNTRTGSFSNFYIYEKI